MGLVVDAALSYLTSLRRSTRGLGAKLAGPAGGPAVSKRPPRPV